MQVCVKPVFHRQACSWSSVSSFVLLAPNISRRRAKVGSNGSSWWGVQQVIRMCCAGLLVTTIIQRSGHNHRAVLWYSQAGWDGRRGQSQVWLRKAEPVYNAEGSARGLCCNVHKKPGMIDVRSVRCAYVGYKKAKPSFNMRQRWSYLFISQV